MTYKLLFNISYSRQLRRSCILVFTLVLNATLPFTRSWSLNSGRGAIRRQLVTGSEGVWLGNVCEGQCPTAEVRASRGLETEIALLGVAKPAAWGRLSF
jgi:hypothetical protein